MPIYKMEGKKNGKQKYRVRINYIDSFGKAKQLDRVVYGLDEAKELERKLQASMCDVEAGIGMTVSELFEEYVNVKKNETRESSLDTSSRIISKHIIPILVEKAVSPSGIIHAARSGTRFRHFNATMLAAIR